MSTPESQRNKFVKSTGELTAAGRKHLAAAARQYDKQRVQITDAPYGMHRTPSPIVDVQWHEDAEFAALMRAWRESQP